jgi:hypothetical protein
MIELSFEQLEAAMKLLRQVKRNASRVHHVSFGRFLGPKGTLLMQFYLHEDKTGGVHRVWWNDVRKDWVS